MLELEDKKRLRVRRRQRPQEQTLTLCLSWEQSQLRGNPGTGAASWNPHLRPRVSRLSQKHMRSCGLKTKVQRITKVKGQEAALAAGMKQESEKQGSESINSRSRVNMIS